MPLFDFYIMVDWSAAASRRAGRSDTIWIAHGPRTADVPVTRSPHSRTETIDLIHSALEKEISLKRRILICFDFAYGYPIDFAAALQAATGSSERDLPWFLTWRYLSEHIKDDEGTAPGAKPNNRSNRFEVANQINALLSADAKEAGPFWSVSSEAAYRYIPQTRPSEPFQSAQGYAVKGLRLTDKRAKSGSPFRLFGTASVGSQSLTGIARLHQLRNDPKFTAISAVWPFETAWATKAKWLPKHVSILHAEIYPSVRNPLPDEIKDRGQVRAMWEWARDLDCDDLLWREFCRPVEVAPGSKEDMAIQLTEGWILGCSPTVTINKDLPFLWDRLRHEHLRSSFPHPAFPERPSSFARLRRCLRPGQISGLGRPQPDDASGLLQDFERRAHVYWETGIGGWRGADRWLRMTDQRSTSARRTRNELIPDKGDPSGQGTHHCLVA